MRHYDLARTRRAWHSDMYRRDANHDAAGWRLEEDADEFPLCECGSELPAKYDGVCLCCSFSRVEVPA